MRLAALISGGKDSIYSAYLASKEHEIAYVISMVSENPESYMFHFPNIYLVKEQARLMGIELLEKKTKGVKEEKLEDIYDVLESIKEGFEIIFVGVAAPPLDRKWLGRKLDEKAIEELVMLNLKHGIHIGGEGR